MIEAMDEPGEQLDLVDSNDQPIGVISRQEVLGLEENGRGFTRAVGIFVVNDQGELWIPQRGEHKKIAPGGLDFSAGEHVAHGESYRQAGLRGLQEELGLTAKASELRLVGSVPPFQSMPYFHQIFLYPGNEVSQYDTGDYTSYEWLSPQMAVARLQGGAPAKEILLPSLQLLLSNQAIEGVHA